MADLSLDPAGNPACSTRKTMAWVTFLSGVAFMGFDLWANGGANTIALAAYTGSGPTLYGLGRANHEFQVSRNGD